MSCFVNDILIESQGKQKQSQSNPNIIKGNEDNK